MSFAVMPLSDYKAACDKVREKVDLTTVKFEETDFGFLRSEVFTVPQDSVYIFSYEFSDSSKFPDLYYSSPEWEGETSPGYFEPIDSNSAETASKLYAGVQYRIFIADSLGLTPKDIFKASLSLDEETVVDFVPPPKIKSGELADKVEEVYEAGRKDGYETGETSGLNVAERVLSDDFTNYSYFCYKRTSCTTLPANLFLHTKNAEDFSYMFQGCTALKEVPLFDTSNGTNFSYMFSSCAALKEAPLFDTSNGTSFDNMFSACTALEEVPLFDMSKGTTAKNMFYNCPALKEIPSFNTRKISSFQSAFGMCKALSKIPSLDLTYCTTLNSTFQSCSALTEVGVLNSLSVSNFSYSFSGCKQLHTVAGIDFSSCTSVNTVFDKCTALANLVVNGKLRATATAFSKLNALTHDSLMSIINALEDYSAGAGSYKITLGSTNLAKLTDEEKLMITNKGWTYA